MSGAVTFAGLLLAFWLQIRSESRSTSSPFRYQKQSEFGFLLLASSGTRQCVLPHPIANSLLISLSHLLFLFGPSLSLSETLTLTMTAPHSAETTLSLVLNPRSQQFCK